MSGRLTAEERWDRDGWKVLRHDSPNCVTVLGDHLAKETALKLAANDDLFDACESAHQYGLAQAELGRSLPPELMSQLWKALCRARKGQQ